MKQIILKFSDKKSKIWVGKDAIRAAGTLFPKEPAVKAVVIADSRLKPFAKVLTKVLENNHHKVETIFIRAEEKLKEFKNIYPLYGELLALRADRQTVIFALGGGVIGDVVGFIAGTYLRGIRWVGVPTTLLAQVDSSVGGKTGINHENGKNLIGVFHQPTHVLCDTNLLKSLPQREVLSGLGEVIKYGLIFDLKLFSNLKKSKKTVFDLDAKYLEKLVSDCLKWKVKTVTQDEKDILGIREVLNFGHTLGHALEAETGFNYFRHGEAVIHGMRAACQISLIRGHLSESSLNLIDPFLKSLPVPEIPSQVSTRALLERLKVDKKTKQGRVRFVLLKDIGQPVLDHGVQTQEIAQALERMRTVSC